MNNFPNGFFHVLKAPKTGSPSDQTKWLIFRMTFLYKGFPILPRGKSLLGLDFLDMHTFGAKWSEVIPKTPDKLDVTNSQSSELPSHRTYEKPENSLYSNYDILDQKISNQKQKIIPTKTQNKAQPLKLESIWIFLPIPHWIDFLQL